MATLIRFWKRLIEMEEGEELEACKNFLNFLTSKGCVTYQLGGYNIPGQTFKKGRK